MSIPRPVPALALTAVAVLGTSCSTVSAALGQFDGDRRIVALVIDSGYATSAELMSAIEPTVEATASEGGNLRAFVVTSGSAGSTRELSFSDEAGGGDFAPDGANQHAWDEAAVRFTEAALDDIESELATSSGASPTGADLVGALNDAIDLAEASASGRRAHAVLVTGGGVHRTADLDLVASRVSVDNAAELAQAAPLRLVDDVDVEIVGAGRFESVDRPLDPAFVRGIEAFWRALRAPSPDHCRVFKTSPSR